MTRTDIKQIYMDFAKVEIFQQINRIQNLYKLSDDEILTLIGFVLLNLGDDIKYEER